MKIFHNKKIQALVSSLMIVMILIPSFAFLAKPKKAEAQFTDFVNSAWQGIQAGFNFINTSSQVTETTLSLKDLAKEILRQVLQAIARRALAEMTKSTVAWINNGFHGAPLFLENPRSFFNDIAKSEVKSMVDIFGYDDIRFPFGRQWALNTISAYKDQLESNAEYSLSQVVDDPALVRRYRTDFSFGGWNAFLINTQYPQNNYPGFQMLANEELAYRIEGTGQNVAQRVQNTLNQGLGFLSTQTCPSNPNYDNNTNPFNPPRFNEAEYRRANPYTPPEPVYEGENTGTESDYVVTNWDLINDYEYEYEENMARARLEFDSKYTCPGGLKTTTPGAVVSSQIMNALGTSQRQGELSAAFGNSLSAVFDALFNKLLGDGLNSLAKRVNPEPEPDDWEFAGQTLGTPDENINGMDDWANQPDELVEINEFMDEVETGITLTDQEIKIMDNPAFNKNLTIGETNMPGIIQLIELYWQEVKKLDYCQPGPDKGWEERLEQETQKALSQLQQFTGGQEFKGFDKSNEALNIIREFRFARDSFKDWIIEKMLFGPLALPNSPVYVDAIKSIDGLYQQAEQTTNARRQKNQVLARLRAIQVVLSTFAGSSGELVQPLADTAQERTLINQRKRFNALKSLISSSFSLDDRQAEFDLLRENLTETIGFNEDCLDERAAKGWTINDEGGPNIDSTLSLSQSTSKAGQKLNILLTQDEIDEKEGVRRNPGQGPCQLATFCRESLRPYEWETTGSEVEQFCQLPAIGGYGHGEYMDLDSPRLSIIEIEGSPAFTVYVNRRRAVTHAFSPRTGLMALITNFYTGDDLSRYATWSDGRTNRGFWNAQDAAHEELGTEELINQYENGSTSLTPPLYPELPMLNSQWVIQWDDNEDGFDRDNAQTLSVSVKCKGLFTSNDMDYKRAGDIGF